jgi:hypothetical protein
MRALLEVGAERLGGPVDEPLGPAGNADGSSSSSSNEKAEGLDTTLERCLDVEEGPGLAEDEGDEVDAGLMPMEKPDGGPGRAELAGLFNENDSFVGGCASDMAKRCLCVRPGRWMEC